MSENEGTNRRVAGPPPRPQAAGASSLIRSLRSAEADPHPESPSLELVPRPASAPIQSKPVDLPSVKITAMASPELRDRVRAAFTMTHAQERHRTFSDFVCAILEAETDRLEKRYNEGQPFDGGDRSLPRGRPLGR